jgi:hypothetical protein
MLLVAASLAWDSGRHPRRGRAAGRGGYPAEPGAGEAAVGPVEPGAGVAAVRPGEPGAGEPAARTRRPRLALAALAAGALYAGVVGWFSRYSWPATVAIIGVGATVVVAGWQGPRHPRPAQPRPPARGLALWGLVLVAGGLWELAALFEQPTLIASSYAHPTISTLTDPVLASWPGRSVVLAGWLGLGWFLSER